MLVTRSKREAAIRSAWAPKGLHNKERRGRRTLNADMDIVLRLLGLSSILIGLREGVLGGQILDLLNARHIRRGRGVSFLGKGERMWICAAEDLRGMRK